jgi:hypothetical protein
MLLILLLIPCFAFAMDTGDLNVKGDLTVTGIISGDGSNLTGIETGSADLSAVDEGIYPDADNTRDIGSSAKSWKDIYSDGTIYSSGASFSGSSERYSGNTYAHYIDFNDNSAALVVSGIEVDNNVYVDKSIYFTSTTASSALYLKQSDGGCSRCGVDAAGTTFSCVDTTCPGGM